MKQQPTPKLTEQADGRSSKSSSYHQYLKRVKHRADRRYAKDCLRNLETPIDTTHRYSGYEL